MTRLSDLVRSRIENPDVGKNCGDWYGQLSPADRGGQELYKLGYESGASVHVVRVQGNRCKTLPEACETMANALEFPGYYGRNTDAFNECFSDLLDLTYGGIGSMFGLAGRPADSLILIIDTADQFLVNELQNRSEIIFSAFVRAASGENSQKRAEFFVCFAGDSLPSDLEGRHC